MSLVERIVPPLIGLLAFGVPTGYLVWQVWLARRSANWPSTTGRILHAEPYRGWVPMPRSSYVIPTVLYEYRVDGRRYTGTRVTFGGWLNASISAGNRVLARYRTGMPVSVRYDPRKPSRCTLERRVSGIVWLFLGIGVFLTSSVFGALMGWWE